MKYAFSSNLHTLQGLPRVCFPAFTLLCISHLCTSMGTNPSPSTLAPFVTPSRSNRVCWPFAGPCFCFISKEKRMTVEFGRIPVRASCRGPRTSNFQQPLDLSMTTNDYLFKGQNPLSPTVQRTLMSFYAWTWPTLVMCASADVAQTCTRARAGVGPNCKSMGLAWLLLLLTLHQHPR